MPRTTHRTLIRYAPRAAFPDPTAAPDWLYMVDVGGTGLYRSDSAAWVLVAGLPLRARKTAATVRNNTAALADDPHLTVPVAANTVYELTCVVFYEGTTTGDLALSWTVPAGVSGTWSPDGLRLAATSGQDQINRVASTNVTGIFTIGGAGATKVMARLTGLLTVGSTAGPLALRWAQATAEASDLTLHADSHLRLDRVT